MILQKKNKTFELYRQKVRLKKVNQNCICFVEKEITFFSETGLPLYRVIFCQARRLIAPFSTHLCFCHPSTPLQCHSTPFPVGSWSGTLYFFLPTNLSRDLDVLMWPELVYTFKHLLSNNSLIFLREVLTNVDLFNERKYKLVPPN